MPHAPFAHRPIPHPRVFDSGPTVLPIRPSAQEVDRVPVFGFILVGGALVGAQVRDIRLANELVRRGYPVHVWWAFDRPHDDRLDPAISQRWLFSSPRYSSFTGTWMLNDVIGRSANRLLSDGARNWIAQNYPEFVAKQMRAILKLACGGVERDGRLVRRFARELSERRVTHVLPNLEMLALFAAAARPHVTHPFKYLVTFQGYEVYATFAREMGCEAELYARLADVVAQSDWPAVAVSEAYAERIQREVHIPAEQLCAIPPGVPVHERIDLHRARDLVAESFPQYRPDLPLISYVGRRDSEKGLDLLLYAAKLLECRGIKYQLAICGPTAFGSTYEKACAQIALHLQVPVISSGYISNELRAALFRVSRAVVYPSIHEEPFGMVPVEAMAQGTPAVVPDIGGVASVVQVGTKQGGLQFASWDSGDLANQLQALIEQEVLHARLSAVTTQVADYFSVERMGERVLDHIGLPRWNGAAGAAASSAPAHADLAAERRRAA
jgi:glycosyltransferase involved in cell wall biosynthesis